MVLSYDTYLMLQWKLNDFHCVDASLTLSDNYILSSYVNGFKLYSLFKHNFISHYYTSYMLEERRIVVVKHIIFLSLGWLIYALKFQLYQ